MTSLPVMPFWLLYSSMQYIIKGISLLIPAIPPPATQYCRSVRSSRHDRAWAGYNATPLYPRAQAWHKSAIYKRRWAPLYHPYARARLLCWPPAELWQRWVAPWIFRPLLHLLARDKLQCLKRKFRGKYILVVKFFNFQCGQRLLLRIQPRKIELQRLIDVIICYGAYY